MITKVNIRTSLLPFPLFQVGVIVVQCLLLILYSSPVFLFMGTCVLGLFISSVFPCMVALTEDMVNYKGMCAHTHSKNACILNVKG